MNTLRKSALIAALLLSTEATYAATITNQTVLPSHDTLVEGVPGNLACLFPSTATPSAPTVTAEFRTYYSPLIAVNPTNPQNIVVIYSRDGFSDSAGPVLGYVNNPIDVLLDYSTTGGSSWNISEIQSSSCATPPGKLYAQVDPLGSPLSFSTNGVLYFAGVTVDSNFSGKSKVFVQKSTNGGAHWTTPVIVDPPGTRSSANLACTSNFNETTCKSPDACGVNPCFVDGILTGSSTC